MKMLRDVYAQSDFVSKDLYPGVSIAKKLDTIAKTPVTVATTDDGLAMFNLPYGPYLLGSLPHRENFPFILHDISLVDDKLYSHGLGSRLVGAAARFALSREFSPSEIHTSWLRLGLVNTFVRVFGESNVSVTHNKRYGWEGELPLEALLDIPASKGGFRVYGRSDIRIMPEEVSRWESPVELT